MHPRNPHSDRYDFERLSSVSPELTAYICLNPKGEQTIDFCDPKAVLCLNGALLNDHYGVCHWELPEKSLCPAIPGRADYVHHLADLLDVTPDAPSNIRILDVGNGSNCVYPIIGSQAYGWKFVASDVDPVALRSARTIVDLNPCLKNRVRVVRQKNTKSIFRGVVKVADRFAACLCNPPFHESAEAAQLGSQRKVRNLSGHRSKTAQPTLNFGGQSNELWCPGGEKSFIHQMITESAEFADQIGWFTSLVSKSAHLKFFQSLLTQANAAEVRVIPMNQGQKQSRILAWRF